MKIAIGSDHAAIEAKQVISELLTEGGHQVEDCGTQGSDSVDYPDFADAVCQRIDLDSADLGILICGTGIGMSIAANKVDGIRAALCRTEFEAQMARAHNNANVLCLGARVTGKDLMLAIVNRFMSTPFDGGRHERRIEKIHALERRQGD
ncbi:MAG: ribose 5-phosphate isomerase B [Acidobacteria bacterium]|nr:ribose 5-phosphate isomerase B [Acidobacteriota bacterium]